MYCRQDDMTNTNLYYSAPTDETFEEMRSECIKQWGLHDNTYGYVDEKTARIKDIKNVQDNFMYMLAMFDDNGKAQVIARLSDGAKVAVRERMIAGGNPEYYVARLGL